MSLFCDVGLHIVSSFVLCLFYWLTGEWSLLRFYAGFFLIGGAGLAVDFDHYRYIRAIYRGVKEEWLKDWEGSGRKFYQTWAFGIIFICFCLVIALVCWYVLFLVPLYVGYIFTVKRRFLLFLRSEWKDCVDKAEQKGIHVCHTFLFSYFFYAIMLLVRVIFPEVEFLFCLVILSYFIHILIDSFTDAELFPQNKLPASINRFFRFLLEEKNYPFEGKDAGISLVFLILLYFDLMVLMLAI